MGTRVIGISIYGPLIPGAKVELQGVGTKPLGPRNYISFDIDADWPDSHLFIEATGYESYNHHVSLPLDGHNKDIVLSDDGPIGPNIINFPPLIPIEEPIEILSPISVLNREFIVDGVKYRPKACTDFLLIQKHATGQDITPILKQRQSLGFDMVRTLTMANNIAQFSPMTYDVQKIVPEVLELCHQFGLRMEVEGFADVQLIGLTKTEQMDHHILVTNIIRQMSNIDIYDLVNEYEKNGIIPDDFPRPNLIISSKGSRVDNKPPKSPYWNFTTYHPRRDGEDYYFSKWRADIGAQSEVYNGVEGEPSIPCPVFPDEPRGFDETNDPNRRSNYPGYAYQIGWLHSVFHNGAMFHSTDGINSNLFRPITLQCAKAFIKGCNDARQGW